MPYLHGTKVLEEDGGARPIAIGNASVIGIVGTAPDADPLLFPINTPVLIAGSARDAAKLDTVGDGSGTLPGALDDIFKQRAAIVVVIRVDADVDAAAEKTNIIGEVDATTGQFKGIEALKVAESICGMKPKILIATGYSHEKEVADALVLAAEKLEGFVYTDGPNTNFAEAVTYRDGFSTRYQMIVDPFLRKWDTATSSEVSVPASATFAGLRAKVDAELGWWESVSNKEILNIVGTARPIDFELGSETSIANLMNENEITTVVRKKGFRSWGARTTSDDPKWAFENCVRINSIIKEAIQEAHLEFVDKLIEQNYVEAVVNSVNAFLRDLSGTAIIDGQCWYDPERNSPELMEQGKITWSYDFTPPAPAENPTFIAHKVNDYYSTITG